MSRFSTVGSRALNLCTVFVLVGVGFGQIPVTTWHYDNFRTGANSSETILTPKNVNSKTFGKVFTQPVDGAIVGQALYMPSVAIPGKGTHNVIYVATMHDSVYAFDADNASGPNSTPLWQVSFMNANAQPMPINLQGCGMVTKWNEVGVLSTPVIDAATGTLYVVAKTYENGVSVHRIHALDVATGSEKPGSPVVVTGSFKLGSKKSTFQDAFQVNRPALLLANGFLYLAFGSNGCRGSKEQGWVMSYDASTLQPAGVFDTEPGSSAGGIWLRGGGLSADADGNVYGETADGPYKDGTNFGMSVFKLSQTGQTLPLTDWFTPYDFAYLNKNDQDLHEPVLLLPDQSGLFPHIAVSVGKEGTVYVMNRDDMGHYCTDCKVTDTQILQELPLLTGPEPGAFVYWNKTLYTAGTASPIAAFMVADGIVAGLPFAESTKGAGGHSPVLSANGTTAGVLWQINGGNLTAYDALTLSRLYISSMNKSRDMLPALPHFANFMVVNGKVYVGTNNSLVVFGLL